MQIDNPQLEEVWFWYDPTADMIIQEEVEPYTVVGIFETEEDADRFIREYGKQYGLEDLSHFEKYHAELNYEEQGPVLEDDSETEDVPDETEQSGFDEFV